MSLNGRLDPGTFDTNTPVLVLRRSIAPFQHGALCVARSLGRLSVPVYSVLAQQGESLQHSRYLTGALDLDPALPVEAWVAGLIAVAPRLGGGILLPIDDAAAVAIGDAQERLAECFRFPAAPEGIQRRLASKHALHELCLELGLGTPVTTSPASETEFLRDCVEQGFPVIVKRGKPWLPPRDPAAPSVFIAHTDAQARRAYARMESDHGRQILVQEYIPGDSDSIWIYNGYTGRAGDTLCAFTGRKLRQRGPRTGPTTLGECVRNDAVAAAARTLLHALGYRGIVDMGFRFDARDGGYKLLDVNPRLGSTFRLFTAENGLDVVRAMHLDLTGRRVPASRCRDGRRWLDERTDIVTAAQLARERRLSARAWIRSLRGIDEAAWWAADDLRPFLSMWRRWIRPAWRRIRRRR